MYRTEAALPDRTQSRIRTLLVKHKAHTHTRYDDIAPSFSDQVGYLSKVYIYYHATSSSATPFKPSNHHSLCCVSDGMHHGVGRYNSNIPPKVATGGRRSRSELLRMNIRYIAHFHIIEYEFAPYGRSPSTGVAIIHPHRFGTN